MYDTGIYCDECHYSCQTCSGGAEYNKCTSCNSDRIFKEEEGICECKDGYSDKMT